MADVSTSVAALSGEKRKLERLGWKAQTAANANPGPQAPASLDFGFAFDVAAREHEVKAGCEKFYNVLYEKKR
jgi:hypothetical protein